MPECPSFEANGPDECLADRVRVSVASGSAVFKVALACVNHIARYAHTGLLGAIVSGELVAGRGQHQRFHPQFVSLDLGGVVLGQISVSIAFQLLDGISDDTVRGKKHVLIKVYVAALIGKTTLSANSCGTVACSLPYSAHLGAPEALSWLC